MKRRNRARRTSDRLARLGGADAKTLQRTPTGRDRFVQMALVLFTTASLAAFAMSFALIDGIDVAWYAAIPFAVLWGFVIFNLDRFLVISMGSTRAAGQLFAIAAPRLLMAAVLAVVISTPLVLRVFKSDIDAQISEYQQEQAKDQAVNQAQSNDQVRANALRVQIDELQAVLDGKLPGSVTSPALQNGQRDADAAQNEVDAKRRAKDVKYEEWQCELYGAGPRCRHASNRRGAGPLAAAKRREYLDATRRLATADGKLKAAQRRLDSAKKAVEGRQGDKLREAQQDARERLGPLQEQLGILTDRIDSTADDATDTNARDDGILAQLRALSRAGDEDSMLRWAHFFVFALFFLLEVLPVTAKILLNLTPPTAYDVLAQSHEDELKDEAQIRRAELRQVEEEKSQARIDIEHDMRARERKVGKGANAKVASQMTAIVEAALDDWSDDVQRQLATRAAKHATAVDDDDHPATNGAAPTGAFAKFRANRAAQDDDGYGLPSDNDL
jgi:hypothetical protein